MVSRIGLLAIPAVVAAAAACGSSTLPAPRILSVDAPAQSATRHIGYIGEDLVLSVTGENFSAGIVANAGAPDDSKADSPRMFIQLQGSATPILVQGTFLSPTLFEGTLPLDPGVYDLFLENGDGRDDRIDGAFQMGHRAAILKWGGPEAEAVGGTANNIELFQMRLVAANELDLGIWKEPLDLTPTFSPMSGTFSLEPPQNPSVWNVPAGETFETVLMTVHDSAAGIVNVTIPFLPTDIALDPPIRKFEFYAGPALRARLLPAAEIADNDFVDTVFQIEDQWGNVVFGHAPYSADFQDPPGGCGGIATVTPDPIVLATNSGPVSVRVTCPLIDDPSVTFSEISNPANFDNGGIVFFPFN